MVSHAEMTEAAKSWIEAWNSRNFENLLNHYASDVVFYSSAAGHRWNVEDGKLVGRQALEKHFRKAFDEFPEMKLAFSHLFIGIDGVLLMYTRENGKMAADLVLFDEKGKIKEVRVFNEV